ncbi:hypothetical protein [Planctomicrobium sp. SH527]|uniref:hypothetical protein n=1 Tax=Planctomicrobium sp. SH527 TaxID=3448123 RepID=UPI003F5B7987
MFCFCVSPLFAQDEGRRGSYGSSGEGGRWDSRRSSGRSFGGEGGFGGRDYRGSESRGSEFRGSSGGFRDGREMSGPSSGAVPSGSAVASPSGAPGTVGTPARTLVLQTRERVTVDLPLNFKEGDIDGDGQIAFYEWRQWKRGDLNGFTALDHNRDGFLTPSELVKGATSSVLAATSSTPTASGTTASPMAVSAGGGSPVSGIQSSATTQVSTASASDSSLETTTNRAKSMFGLLDKDANGQLNEEEWKRSTRIRSQFMEAGIDLSGSMPKDAFIAHYLKLNSGAG